MENSSGLSQSTEQKSEIIFRRNHFLDIKSYIFQKEEIKAGYQARTSSRNEMMKIFVFYS